MNPADVVSLLTGAGPYAVTVIVLVWLWFERAERQASQNEVRSLNETIRNDRKEQAVALAELGEATRNTLRDLELRVSRRSGGRE
jgi:hypothetical protein